MKPQQTTIAEVRLVYRTKIKASERLQIKFSKDAFEILGPWLPELLRSNLADLQTPSLNPLYSKPIKMTQM